VKAAAVCQTEIRLTVDSKDTERCPSG